MHLKSASDAAGTSRLAHGTVLLVAAMGAFLAFPDVLDSAESLVEAIRAVADGQTRVPGRLLTTVCASLPARGTGEADDDTAIRRLSERELDVLRCLVDGLCRKEIALRLGIAANTVRSHVQSILHKFEVHSTLTAVAVARRAGVKGTPRPISP